MNDLKQTITEQLQQTQKLMWRASFRSGRGKGMKHSPHRGQGRVLSLLKIKDAISQRELSYLLDMSRQALAELLAKMEAAGLIIRTSDDNDKRTLIVCLTDDGKKAAHAVEGEASKSPTAFDVLSDDELAQFSDYLERINAAYEAQYPEVDFAQKRKAMAEFLDTKGGGNGCGPRMPKIPRGPRMAHHHVAPRMHGMPRHEDGQRPECFAHHRRAMKHGRLQRPEGFKNHQQRKHRHGKMNKLIFIVQ